MTDPRPPVTRYEISTKLGRYMYVLAQEHDKELARLEARITALDAERTGAWLKVDLLEAQVKMLQEEVNAVTRMTSMDIHDELQRLNVALQAKLTEANAIIADTTKAYERYEIRLHEASERERRLREPVDDRKE